MRKLIIFLVTGMLWCNSSYAENVYDYLEYDTEVKYGNWLYVIANNKHGSKKINLKHIRVWFSTCSASNNNDPDRIFSIDRIVRPYEEIEYRVSKNFNHKGKWCRGINAKFIDPPKPTKKKKYKPVILDPTPEKSGAQKLLDKIFGK